jgi:hypothetical protein
MLSNLLRKAANVCDDATKKVAETVKSQEINITNAQNTVGYSIGKLIKIGKKTSEGFVNGFKEGIK